MADRRSRFVDSGEEALLYMSVSLPESIPVPPGLSDVDAIAAATYALGGAQIPAEIARRAGRSEQEVSEAIKVLIERGYVEPARDWNNMWRLTREGRTYGRRFFESD